MIPRLWLLGFALVIALSFAAPATSDDVKAAAPKGPVVYPTDGEVVGDNVYIRAKAEQTADGLSYSFKGDKLRVLGETGADWYVVELPRSYTLWISKEFVKVGADKEAVVAGEGVRVRAGAGLAYDTLGHLSAGRKIEIVSEKDGWFEFKFLPGDRGFIAKQYVKLAGDEAPRVAAVKPEPPKPLPTPKPEPVPLKPEPPKPLPPKPEPVKTEPTAAELQAEKDALDAFARGEDIYMREVKKENIAEWKLDDAQGFYLSAMDKSHDPALLSKCRSRLAVITLAQRYRDASKTQGDPREKLKEREDQIDKEFASKRAMLADEIHKLFPTCIAVGRVEKLATASLQPATHKLIRADRVIYLLRSDAVDLSACEDKFVGIEGEVDASVKWPIATIRVTGIVLPGETPAVPAAATK